MQLIRSYLLTIFLAGIMVALGCALVLQDRYATPIVEAQRDVDLGNIWQVHVEPSHGSGFPVASYELEDGSFDVYFLTAAHVVQEELEFFPDLTMYMPVTEGRLTHHGGGDLEWELVEIYDEEDAALIVVNTPVDIPCRRLLKQAPDFGDSLIAGGYANGELRVMPGLASAAGDMSCHIIAGMSGGPVCLPNGDVIGLVRGYWIFTREDGTEDHQKNFSLYTQISDVSEWLEFVLPI